MVVFRDISLGVMATQKTAKTILGALFGAMLVLPMMQVPAHADFLLVAVLNSQQEIQNPKPDSNAFGNALMTFQESNDMLCYSISYSMLERTEFAAHFHAPASAGENADIVHDITPAVSPVGSPKTGCVGPLSKQEKRFLRRGLFYINVHSDPDFRGGEIRGQVVRVKEARQTKDETVADTN